jgi:hypothetical protein
MEELAEAKPKAKQRVKLRGYHGSPHKFPPSQRYRNTDTGETYVANLENPVHMKLVSEGNFEPVGEPNQFGMFDLSKAGTGEGGQAYGMGHYIAQRKETGEFYRDSTTMRNFDFEDYLSEQYDKAQSNNDYYRMEMLESAMLHDRPSDFRAKATDLDYDEEYRQAAANMADEMESYRDSNNEPVNFGYIYEVEIDALQEEMFDYDATIGAQSDFVREALYDARESVDQKIVDDYFDGDRSNIVNHDMPGTTALFNLGKAEGTLNGWENVLSSRGVKGVQYDDQRSRDGGDSSKNYVVFNDETLNILNRYGLPATLTATAAAGAGAPQESQAGVRKAGETLFDLSRLDEVPDVPQIPLERITPARGLSPKIAPLLTPEAAARMEGYANIGKDKGGLGWYNLDPLRQAFMEELGDEQGTSAFNSFVDKLAATSPRAKVANNIRRASYLDVLDRQGQPFAGLKNDDLPPGYGHIAHKTHDASLQDLQDSGSFAALNRPKTSSFAENLKGNQAPMTIDTHNFAALKGDPKNKKSPADTQYKYLEEFQGEIAKKMGMTPAQFQASVWMGGETGVADDRPFMAVFDDVVANTAERDGVTKKKALQNFIQGKGVLYDLGPVMLAGGLGANLLANDFNEQASAVGEVAAAGLTSLAAPFLTGPTSFLESMNPAIPVDELERRRAARQDRVTSEIRSPLAQAYAEQAKQAVAPILQDINQNPYLNALPFDELYEYGSEAVKDLPARLRFMGGALLDSTGL